MTKAQRIRAIENEIDSLQLLWEFQSDLDDEAAAKSTARLMRQLERDLEALRCTDSRVAQGMGDAVGEVAS